MKYIRAKAGFIRYTDDTLVIATNRIIESLQQSPYFTEPTPSLKELTAAYMDYFEKVTQAKAGGVRYNAAKRDSKKKLAKILQQLVSYINRVADGDLVKLYSSGFPIVDKKRKGRAPTAPEYPSLKDGRISGQIAYKFKPVGRDMLYEFCFANSLDKKGNPLWGEVRSSSRSFWAYQDGFECGTNVYFKVRARNKHGVSDWSIVVMWMVR